MEQLSKYIVIVVMGICYCVGFIIKNYISTDKINKFIPLIMGVLGILLNMWVNEWNISPEIILGGLVSGLATTGLNEAITQLIHKQGGE